MSFMTLWPYEHQRPLPCIALYCLGFTRIPVSHLLDASLCSIPVTLSVSQSVLLGWFCCFHGCTYAFKSIVYKFVPHSYSSQKKTCICPYKTCIRPYKTCIRLYKTCTRPYKTCIRPYKTRSFTRKYTLSGRLYCNG